MSGNKDLNQAIFIDGVQIFLTLCIFENTN